MDPQGVQQTSTFIWRRLLEAPPTWALALPVGFALLAILLLGLLRRDHRLRWMTMPLIVVGIISAIYVIAGLRIFISLFSWWYLLAPTLAVALLYVGLMYRKDSASVHPGIAGFLGLLRCLVYAILTVVFLLPGCQTFDKSQYHSKVLMLFDVSGSMVSTIDDLPEVGQDPAKLPTRQDKVVRFLAQAGKDGDKAFLDQVVAKTPVTAYRFGSMLDETEIPNWSPTTRPEVDALSTWLKPDRKHYKPRDDLPAEKKAEAQARYYDQVDALLGGTNIGGAGLQMAKLEGNNYLQAVVIFSDGQNNLGSDEALRDFVNRLSGGKQKVPIFTVGVGEYRLPASIRIDDLQAPETARPDDKFPVRVPVIGSGLVDEEFTVRLEVTRVKDALGQPVAAEQTYVLEPKTGKFQGAGDFPQDTIEFEIDVQELKKIKVDEDKDGELEGTWQFVAKVPRHPREPIAEAEHVTKPAVEVLVQKRKMRVLLFAGGPTREYQFLRTLLFREVLEKRLDLSIHLQTGRDADNVDQDVEKDRFLQTFPHKLGPADASEKFLSLNDYDVIVAIDPDWLALEPTQFSLLKEWVGTHSGGIVFVAGPVNTYQLVRAAAVDISALTTLLPVHLNDSRLHGLQGIGHDASRPYPLNFTPAARLFDFLKLDESEETPTAGWNRFFWGDQKPGDKGDRPLRGFYNYYPINKIKADSSVIATFAGPEGSRINDGKDEQPFMVSMRFGNGKSMFLGSAETWRLRHAKDSFHERFWIKLCRYMSAGATQQKKYGRILLARTSSVGNIPFEAQLKGADLLPLPQDMRPMVVVKKVDGLDGGAPKKDETFELKPKQTQGEWAGWFAGNFKVKDPGEYEFSIPIPGTNESLTQRLTVRKPNPETDNVRNNFGLLHQLASNAKDAIDPLPAETRKKILGLLQPIAAESPGSPGDGPRLFFKLDQAGAIAECLRSIPPREVSVKGKLFDLWDDGWRGDIKMNSYYVAMILPLAIGVLGGLLLLFMRQFLFAALFVGTGVVLALAAFSYDAFASPTWPDLPLQMSFVLAGLVTLLGVEWLTRKLLKLA